jgi:hypothetical protein
MFESQPTSIQAVWLTGGADRQAPSTPHASLPAPLLQALGGLVKRMSRWSGKVQDTACASFAASAPAHSCPARSCR